MEFTVSGYCRAQDQARIVMAEEEDGVWDIACDFPNCPYTDACTIARELKKITGGLAG